jgi:hypothetical protein
MATDHRELFSADAIADRVREFADLIDRDFGGDH